MTVSVAAAVVSCPGAVHPASVPADAFRPSTLTHKSVSRNSKVVDSCWCSVAVPPLVPPWLFT